MKNIFSKIDNFIVNKINFKIIICFIFGCMMTNCFNYYVHKYGINGTDNILMVLSLYLSILSWFEIFSNYKNNK